MSKTNLPKQYLDLNTKIKELEELKDELKIQLMALDGQEVDGYTISVKESKSDRIESLKAIKDKSPSLFQALHDAGCVKEIISTRVNVKEIKNDNNY
jgi:hypothetical protein